MVDSIRDGQAKEIQALKVELTLANHAYNELSLSYSAMVLEKEVLKKTRDDLSESFWKLHKERNVAEREVKRLNEEMQVMRNTIKRLTGLSDLYYEKMTELQKDKIKLIDGLRQIRNESFALDINDAITQIAIQLLKVYDESI